LIGEEGDDNLEALHQKVLAVCSINHHCAIDGLAILAIPCSNKVGSECAVIFSRIDSVTK
jgi:hypothetical protein